MDQTIDMPLVPLALNDARASFGLETAAAAGASDGVRGPYCVYARTIDVRHRWTTQATRDSNQPAVTIHEPCLWEPPHPFLYTVRWQERERSMGLRQFLATPTGLRLNGQAFTFRGMAVTSPVDEARLRTLHDAGVNLLWDTPAATLAETDRFGPFTSRVLPDDRESACALVRQHGLWTPSLAIWRSQRPRSAEEYRRLRQLDSTSLFAEVAGATPVPAADLLLVTIALENAAVAAQLPLPYLVLVAGGESSGWAQQAELLDKTLLPLPGCIGWVCSGDLPHGDD